MIQYKQERWLGHVFRERYGIYQVYNYNDKTKVITLRCDYCGELTKMNRTQAVRQRDKYCIHCKDNEYIKFFPIYIKHCLTNYKNTVIPKRTLKKYSLQEIADIIYKLYGINCLIHLSGKNKGGAWLYDKFISYHGQLMYEKLSKKNKIYYNENRTKESESK